MTHLAILGLPSGAEWIILAFIGLIVFGKRLPEVGRSLGRSIVEFKKGVKGVEDEVERESSASGTASLKPYDERLGGKEAELRRLQGGAAPTSSASRVAESARPGESGASSH